MVPTGIGPSTIAQNKHTLCIGINPLQMVLPIIEDVITHKLGGVLACSQGDVSFIIEAVINSVGDNNTRCVGKKIMVKSPAFFFSVIRLAPVGSVN